MFAPHNSTKLFSHVSVIGGIGFLLCVLALAVAPASGRQDDASVVIVYAGNVKGYGVCYGAAGYIVTAMHVVAGRSDISVKWGDQEAPATPVKYYKEADLALLKTDLTIQPLGLYRGTAPAGRSLNYWEYSTRLGGMDKRATTLNLGKGAIPLKQFDDRLAADPNTFKKALCQAGQGVYPELNTNVLKFQERNVGPSHSGSPLTYQGQIVGMVDGGDKPLGGKACVWAIPASYFETLWKSAPAAYSIAACAGKALYSGPREEAEPFEVYDDSNDRLAFDLEFSVPFGEVYDTMFEEDQGYIQDLVAENEATFKEGRVELAEVLNQPINIYEDETTGATIAVPAASELSIEKEAGHTLIEASSPYGGISMIIFVQNTNSVEESKEAMNWFKEYIVSDRKDWVSEANEKDEIEDLLDEDEPYYNELFERVAYEDDNLVAELYASLTIDGTDFLGVVVKVNDWATLDDDKDERIFFYLMEACTVLSDFAYY